jgi:hypothetical protein
VNFKPSLAVVLIGSSQKFRGYPVPIVAGFLHDLVGSFISEEVIEVRMGVKEPYAGMSLLCEAARLLPQSTSDERGPLKTLSTERDPGIAYNENNTAIGLGKAQLA